MVCTKMTNQLIPFELKAMLKFLVKWTQQPQLYSLHSSPKDIFILLTMLPSQDQKPLLTPSHIQRKCHRSKVIVGLLFALCFVCAVIYYAPSSHKATDPTKLSQKYRYGLGRKKDPNEEVCINK